MRLLTLGFLVGCGQPAPGVEPAPTPAAASDTSAQALATTEAGARQLGKALKTALSEAMASGGPHAAVTVCNAEAPAFTAAVAESSGVQVGRSSLRLRNPDNVGPEWVQAWLDAQGERKAEGVAGVRDVVDGEARVIVPIPVEGLCLTCHGSMDQIPAEVQAVVSEKYPDDRATGYVEGDLRGALWATLEVD